MTTDGAETAPWLPVALGLATAATALGLSRFGYSVLLPAMRTDLGWSYATAGSITTPNAFGYLIGALASPLVLRAAGPTSCLRWAAAGTALTLGLCATTDVVVLLWTLRAVGGAAAAVLFVAGGLLAATLADRVPQPGAVLGVFYAGVGPGVLLSTLLGPLVLGQPDAWRHGWLVLGLLTATCALAAGWSAGVVAAPATQGEPSPAGVATQPSLARPAVAFALFGLGYIPFMTFAVAYWRDVGGSVAVVSSLWAVLAGAATLSGWALRRWIDRPDRGLWRLLALCAAGAALPVLSVRLPVLVVSSALFGGAFLAVTAATTQLIRARRPPHERRRALAAFTSVFAAGQVAGPVATGWLADLVGLRGGLALAAVLLASAAVVAAPAVRVARPGHPVRGDVTRARSSGGRRRPGP